MLSNFAIPDFVSINVKPCWVDVGVSAGVSGAFAWSGSPRSCYQLLSRLEIGEKNSWMSELSLLFIFYMNYIYDSLFSVVSGETSGKVKFALQEESMTSFRVT